MMPCNINCVCLCLCCVRACVASRACVRCVRACVCITRYLFNYKPPFLYIYEKWNIKTYTYISVRQVLIELKLQSL